MTAVEGLRTVIRYAAVNPRVGTMLMWAAEHDVDPRIYTPLIARAIHEPFEEQKQKPQPTVSPDTHMFSTSEWQRKNPGLNVTPAATQALHMGYEVRP
jgi:hypothetical protein